MVTFLTHEYPKKLPDNSTYLCKCEILVRMVDIMVMNSFVLKISQHYQQIQTNLLIIKQSLIIICNQKAKKYISIFKIISRKRKKVKRIGYAALLPPDWFYELYENPKQEAEDSLFEYICKASQFNKKPIDFYDCIVVPAELEEYWILFFLLFFLFLKYF